MKTDRQRFDALPLEVKEDILSTIGEIPEYELTEAYRETLRELYGSVTICGLEYDQATALERLDATAFRCGFSDWLSAEEENETYVDLGAFGYVHADQLSRALDDLDGDDV